MLRRTENLNPKDWPSVAICAAVSLLAAAVMAFAVYSYRHIPDSFFTNPNNYKLADLLDLSVEASVHSGFFTICLSISLCGSVFKSWLRWPILLGATAVAGAYSSSLKGILYGTDDAYCCWQIYAFSTVSISFVLLLGAQRMFGAFSLGSSRQLVSHQIPLSGFFLLTFLCSAICWVLVSLRPSSISMPSTGNLYTILGIAACVCLPVPIAAYVAFSNSRRKLAAFFLVALLPALATALHIWMDDGQLPYHALMFFLSQVALFALLTALRFRGIRRDTVG